MGNTLCRCQKLAGPDVALHPRCFGQVWIFEGIPPEAWESLAGDLVAPATEFFGERPYSSHMARTTKRTEEKP